MTPSIQSPIKIAIPGAAGRMGQMLIREIAASDDLQLVAATDRPGSDAINMDAGQLAGTGENGVIISDDPAVLFQNADVVVDFSSPAASVAHAGLAAKHSVGLVVGTTGLTVDDEKLLAAAGKHSTLVYCANTSLGVTLIGNLVEQVAAQLVDGWDIEVLETHHHHKVDAPSGTALALGHAAARGRGVALDDVADMVRQGQTGARKKGDIGFSVLRGGDVAGEHSVIFFGEAERVEITHKANDRVIFARGALRAARFAASAATGFYNMEDVLAG
ncbi:MAG: 4-hydroxy-tetrahydrodipicolinate reductase [Bacteroidetes bacterium]|nr:4-hydroxy-tetrahydrodipicolinate reductase [Bacteroidota bacterium]